MPLVSSAGLRRRLLASGAVLALAACRGEAASTRAASTGDPGVVQAQCQVVAHNILLPEGLKESSGLVESRAHPGVYWSHNDSGHGPDLFALNAAGALLGQVHVTGAQNRDWEDIAIGPCPSAGGDCLYLADTGNNASSHDDKGKQRGRHEVTLVVLREPDWRQPTSAPATEYTASFPRKRTDIEALAVFPDGRVYLVSKGINGPVELFRWPTPLASGVTLEAVRELAPKAAEVGDRVTGASVSPDGRWVAVRTYAALAFYRAADLLGNGRPVSQLDLAALEEPQGEAVSLANDGQVLLSSEGHGKHFPAVLSQLRCALPR